MRILAISKSPEFDEDGQPILGQCGALTDGWRLSLRVVGERTEEVLLTGTYRRLRRVQRRCIGKTPDEIRAIVNDARLSPEVEITQDDSDSTTAFGREEIQRAMREMEGVAEQEEVKLEPHLQELASRAGIHVAHVAADLIEANETALHLHLMLASAASGLVLDLSALSSLGPKATQMLRELGEHARAEKHLLAAVSGNEKLKKVFNETSLDALIGLHPDVETAIGELARVQKELE